MLEPGVKIGTFELGVHLDKGGMADIFLANRVGTQALVVLKILHSQPFDDPEATALFLQEGRILSGLYHSNVVQVIEHGFFKDRAYIAMEHLHGHTIGHVRRRLRRLELKCPPATMARLFLQAVDGLTYVHGSQDEYGRPLDLIHNDISPDNIFLCSDGTVKLIDFGVALTRRSDQAHFRQIRGKAAYLSPEEIRGDPPDARCDLFSMGIVMWEMLVGQHLFQGKKSVDVMKKIVTTDAPSPRSCRPEVPRELDYIVSRCLKRDRDERMQTAIDLKRGLQGFLTSRAGRREDSRALDRIMARMSTKRKRGTDIEVNKFCLRKGIPPFSDPGLGRRPDPNFALLPTRTPSDRSVTLEHWDPGLVLCDALQKKEEFRALEAYRDLKDADLKPNLASPLAVRLAEILESSNMYLDAAHLLVQAAQKDPDGPLATTALFNAARLYLIAARRRNLGICVLDHLVRNYPEDELAREAAQKLARLRRRSANIS